MLPISTARARAQSSRPASAEACAAVLPSASRRSRSAPALKSTPIHSAPALLRLEHDISSRRCKVNYCNWRLFRPIVRNENTASQTMYSVYSTRKMQNVNCRILISVRNNTVYPRWVSPTPRFLFCLNTPNSYCCQPCSQRCGFACMGSRTADNPSPHRTPNPYPNPDPTLSHSITYTC